MWIDNNQLNTSFEKEFLTSYSKVMILCQKVEMALQYFASIIRTGDCVDTQTWDKRFMELLAKYTSIHKSATVMESVFNSDHIITLINKVGDIRNEIAHSFMYEIIYFLIEPTNVNLNIENIIIHKTKVLHDYVLLLGELDNGLNIWELGLKEGKKSESSVFKTYHFELLKWIFPQSSVEHPDLLSTKMLLDSSDKTVHSNCITMPD